MARRALTWLASLGLVASVGCTELHLHDAAQAGDETGDFEGSESEGEAEGGEAEGSGSTDDAGTSDTGDESGEPQSEPFDRFIAVEVTGEGWVVDLIPGPDMQALIPEALTISLFLPNEDHDGPLVMAALDETRAEIFRVEVEGDITLVGNERPGLRIGLQDLRKTPMPTNCTFPPCPGENSDTGYVVSYDEDDITWTIGQVDEVMFGHGVREVNGEIEVVPFEAGRDLPEQSREKLVVAEYLFEDGNEFLNLDNSTVPPQAAGFWDKVCQFGKWGLKGAITLAQGGCCAVPGLGLGACVTCAVAGEAGKDGVDAVDCEGK